MTSHLRAHLQKLHTICLSPKHKGQWTVFQTQSCKITFIPSAESGDKVATSATFDPFACFTTQPLPCPDGEIFLGLLSVVTDPCNCVTMLATVFFALTGDRTLFDKFLCPSLWPARYLAGTGIENAAFGIKAWPSLRSNIARLSDKGSSAGSFPVFFVGLDSNRAALWSTEPVFGDESPRWGLPTRRPICGTFGIRGLPVDFKRTLLLSGEQLNLLLELLWRLFIPITGVWGLYSDRNQSNRSLSYTLL